MLALQLSATRRMRWDDFGIICALVNGNAGQNMSSDLQDIWLSRRAIGASSS